MSRVALLIGVKLYKYDVLKPSYEDVKAIRDVLRNPNLGAFDVHEPLLNPDPNQMRKTIELFSQNLSPDDVGLLFLSGYGITTQQGKLYFATRTTRFTQEQGFQLSTLVSAHDICDILDRSRSKNQVVIFDCWFNAELDGSTSSWIDFQQQLGAKHRLILTTFASTKQRYKALAHNISPFTYYLQEGIETGLADLNRDGRISVWDLYYYLDKEAPHLAPQFFTPNPSFDVPLAKAVDPRQKYREIVQQLVRKDGTISAIGRAILELWRKRLRLTPANADRWEEETFRLTHPKVESIEQYREVLTRVRMRNPLDDETKQELQELQRLLRLSGEDAQQIESAMWESADGQPELDPRLEQARQQYREAVTRAVRQHFPLRQTDEQQLRQLQIDLQLSDDEAHSIKQSVIQHQACLNAYRQWIGSLPQVRLLQDESLPAALDNLRQQLGLAEEDVEDINRDVRERRYQNALQQYRQSLEQLIRDRQLGATGRAQLRKICHDYHLNSEDVTFIRKEVIAQEKAKREYQRQLKSYGEELYNLYRSVILDSFGNVTQEQHQSLRNRYPDLKEEDIADIEREVLTPIWEKQANRQQYEAEVRLRLQMENPLSEGAQQALRELRERLNLSEDEANLIEENVSRDFPPPPPPPLAPSTLLPPDPPSVDFTLLEEYLGKRKWKDADQETLNLLLSATKRTHEGWLDAHAIASLPEADLRRIDELWGTHSNNRFGFSVQRRIYERLRNPTNQKKAVAFAKQVGWWTFLFFKYYSGLNFKRDASNSAPEGHFPAYWYWKIPWNESMRALNPSGRGGGDCDRWMLSAWMERLRALRIGD